METAIKTKPEIAEEVKVICKEPVIMEASFVEVTGLCDNMGEMETHYETRVNGKFIHNTMSCDKSKGYNKYVNYINSLNK